MMRSGSKNERCQVDEYSRTDQRHAYQCKKDEHKWMNAQETDDFHQQAEDDQHACNPQKPMHSNFTEFHCTGLHIFKVLTSDAL